ncbi:hypothetical protein ENKO_416 [Klebsiella phage fENko-Kae01]|uniref:hypothetical protein n=1 Tax=Salmonella enterica TaxID=28901 RepID=UPI002B30A547|nr:hypothetical protein [Klebsiella phage fENko-Kae01]
MLEEHIIKRIQISINNSEREVQRMINHALERSKYILVFPVSSNEEEDDPVYDSVYVSFDIDNEKVPKFVPKHRPNDIWHYELNDNCTFDMDWCDIAVHMQGSVWIESSRIKKPELEHVPFTVLDDIPVLKRGDNSLFASTIMTYLRMYDNESYEMEETICNYLDSLPPEDMSIDNVYIDVTDDDIPYGRISSVIRVNGETIGYMSQRGRELLDVRIYAYDNKKCVKFIEDVIDKLKLRDKMIFDSINDIDPNSDADEFLPVPGYTTKRHEGN